MSLDLAPALREAILANTVIVTLLGAGNVHTRRPVPTDAAYPLIVISPDITLGDADGLTSRRPVVRRDVAIYGRQPDQYRDVEAIGYAVRELFHRQNQSISPAGYHVIDLVASGPIVGPSDDASVIARIVTLTIQVQPEGE